MFGRPPKQCNGASFRRCTLPAVELFAATDRCCDDALIVRQAKILVVAYVKDLGFDIEYTSFSNWSELTWAAKSVWSAKTRIRTSPATGCGAVSRFRSGSGLDCWAALG